jgi:hypothetical protein
MAVIKMSKPVLITTALIVHVPDEHADTFTFVEPFTDQFCDAIEKAFQDSPFVEYPRCVAMEWVDAPDANIGKCSECNCWVTDGSQPDGLKGIPAGRLREGQWICDECETFG